MTKRVFIVHSWHGTPTKHWVPWLKRELENHGFEVTVPQMPDPNTIKIEEWVTKLKSTVGDTDQNTYFVGHSIGCQTILRYMEKLPSEEKIGGAIFVAPWMHLLEAAFDTPHEKTIAQPWINNPINWKAIIKHTKKFVSIFSEDDPYVPISDSDIFSKELNSRIIVENNKGHFIESSGVMELPIALKAVLELSYNK